MKRPGFIKLLRRYLKGNINEIQRYVVDSWYDSFGESTDGVPGLETPESTEASRLRIYQKARTSLPALPWYRGHWLPAAAAILIISLCLFWYKQSLVERPQPEQSLATLSRTIHTGSRQIKKIQLPDSTMIWLNANSQLAILPGYGLHGRQVMLHGEAFFEVSQHKRQPFILKANDLSIKVLGTSFNVQAYEELEDIRVSVSTGAVQVSDTVRNGTSRLIAGQGMSYHKSSGQYVLTDVSPVSNRLWTEGKVVLERATFKELTLAVHNLYGVSLESHNKEATSTRYNLTLHVDQPEKDLLALICSISKTQVRKEGNHVTLY